MLFYNSTRVLRRLGLSSGVEQKDKVRKSVATERSERRLRRRHTPLAQIGSGVFFDHATRFVVGEMAAIGNGYTILHSVSESVFN